ncbi:phenylalanine 4-monooxygenase [Streptomyces mobaraensis NBRC 13819 = DSM 40847]|uniref:Phenylalanine 4-monooxygenase n=1 Tax=Streptomyces mobaraensis (strain ATCC 29032 / DSM 40847 / JCM 4168 / NBRC 13819 / NCIMB 11159 / IPCR 16-22) TaxID=1223523 RepID=M3A7T3_STRM1|nr:phenylalanine 4-monooxygenase [Streptomyces mobaraensis]EMF01224.1 phenylalanine 4-monooxygenase [Streptomyces mobaraensis NBRC 13819 = DSM 40847]QTT76630.1 phenylalanine 4-monooxygenase [Streptomyces mobaraensis NBRC 13819 = DSM 40847]
MDTHGVPPVQEPYGPVDQEVWRHLYRQQAELVPAAAPPLYLEGLALLGLPTDHVPDLGQVNERLSAVSGWTCVAVDGLVKGPEFFDMLLHRRFPVTSRMRAPEELRFARLPDLFHDLFGHGPYLAHARTADLYQEFGRIGVRCAGRPEDFALLQGILWSTLETGLIRMPGGLRALGGAILSSADEIRQCLDPACPVEPFDPEVVRFATYDILRLQSRYFAVEDLEEIESALADLDALVTDGGRS